MKLVFRISSLGFGGAEQVFLSLAKEFMFKQNIEILFLVDRLTGENVKTAKNLGFTVRSLEVKRTLNSILPMKNFIDEFRPDVIISAYTDTNAACLMAGFISKYKAKIIVSEHASLNEHWKSKSSFKRLLLKFYVAYIYRLSNAVVCVSNGLKSQVSSLLKTNQRIETIYNPVRFSTNEIYTAELEHGLSNPLKLLAVGRICEQKNYETLLSAVGILAKIRPCELRIVGGIFCQKEYERLQNKIVQLNIEASVFFEGYSDNVAEFYKKSDIFVLSSAWEGFGNVIVEAMSFGLPIVSTNCNYGPAEILENGKYGRLVPVGDHRALARAVVAELDKPTLTKMQLVGRSKDFSEQVIAKQYFDIISEVLDEKA